MTNTNADLPTTAGADFNFWDDVVGDDLVVDGVVYSRTEWQHDGEGGVERRQEPPHEEGENDTTDTNETPHVPTVEDAARTFAEIFRDGMLINSLAESMTCMELDALAGLLRAAGEPTAADNWTAIHARGDEHGDAHYPVAPRADHRPRSFGCELTFDVELDGANSLDGPCPECEPWAAMTAEDVAIAERDDDDAILGQITTKENR